MIFLQNNNERTRSFEGQNHENRQINNLCRLWNKNYKGNKNRGIKNRNKSKSRNRNQGKNYHWFIKVDWNRFRHKLWNWLLKDKSKKEEFIVSLIRDFDNKGSELNDNDFSLFFHFLSNLSIIFLNCFSHFFIAIFSNSFISCFFFYWSSRLLSFISGSIEKLSN